MTIKQIQFVNELKTNITTGGFPSVKEWTNNFEAVLSEEYDCFIQESSTSGSGDRSSVIETTYFKIILCINKSVLTPSNLEDVIKTKMSSLKSAIYNTIVGNVLLEKGSINGENQIIDNSLFSNSDYIAFEIGLLTVFVNSY